MWLYYFSTFRRVVLQLYRQVRYSPPYILGTGGGGTCPQKGGCAPIARACLLAIPVLSGHAVMGLTMRYHIKFQKQAATKSALINLPFISSFESSCHSGPRVLLMPNRHGFKGKWA